MLGLVMAASQPSPRLDPDGDPRPLLRRPRPDDAVDLASATFLEGSRVDMQTLAARLGISPATLYRWFGSRAGLLEAVFERIAEEFAAQARSEAQGRGRRPGLRLRAPADDDGGVLRADQGLRDTRAAARPAAAARAGRAPCTGWSRLAPAS